MKRIEYIGYETPKDAKRVVKFIERNRLGNPYSFLYRCYKFTLRPYWERNFSNYDAIDQLLLLNPLYTHPMVIFENVKTTFKYRHQLKNWNRAAHGIYQYLSNSEFKYKLDKYLYIFRSVSIYI